MLLLSAEPPPPDADVPTVLLRQFSRATRLPGVLRAAALVYLTTLFSQIAYRSVTELIVKDDLTRLGVSRSGLKNERSNYSGVKMVSTLNPISSVVRSGDVSNPISNPSLKSLTDF